MAGCIVGVVAVPLAMAFAIASGARPEQGLYTAIVAGLCTSLFGGTRLQISGPTGAFIAVLALISAQHGIAGLQLATLMAGLILIGLGVARLGRCLEDSRPPARSRARPLTSVTGQTARSLGWCIAAFCYS
jgi:sulfate permease, SulP family